MRQLKQGELGRPTLHRFRGTASIEAIMVLTLFILIWAGVSYMGRLYQGKLLAQADARSCAWKISLSYCENTPPECQMVEEEIDASSKGNNLARVGQNIGENDPKEEQIHTELDSEIEGLLMKRISTSSEREVRTSPLIEKDKKKVTVSSGYSLPCNSKPKKSKNQENMTRGLVDTFKETEDDDQ